MTILYLSLAVLIASAVSLLGGVLLLRFKEHRHRALLATLPFGAGALLAAAFFDLLPESLEIGSQSEILTWTLIGFTSFFILERLTPWFHHHHEHNSQDVKDKSQRRLIIVGDIMHNAIDGLAIGAAFLVSIPTGIITAIAVSIHEIPKELGTFAILLSRGWKDSRVLIVNIATSIVTLLSAIAIFLIGPSFDISIGPLLALTAGAFIYIAASDIIPDIHEQTRRVGTIQAIILLGTIVIVAYLISLLGV